MTDRERLLQILNVAIFPHEGEDPLEAVTDYLLDNGVTFATENNVGSKWIPVSERLPEERDSIFKKFYGTNKWTSAMFQTTSDDVLVVASYKDGSKSVKTMRTLDGEWRIADGRPWNVTHWMPLPEPPKEDADD